VRREGGGGQVVKNQETGGRPLLQSFNVPPRGNNQLSETPEDELGISGLCGGKEAVL
jgi:hypothetical protein